MINELKNRINVEFGEEFKIRGYETTFYLDKECLWRYERNAWVKSLHHLGLIVLFPEYVIKIPFKPTIGTQYYAPNWDSDNIWVEPWESSGELWDDLICNNGLAYRTQKEAELNLYEDYKKVTGREWVKKN